MSEPENSVFQLISELDHVVSNIRENERRIGRFQSKYVERIKLGQNFIAYYFNGEVKFLPSRLVGYVNKNLEHELKSRELSH